MAKQVRVPCKSCGTDNYIDNTTLAQAHLNIFAKAFDEWLATKNNTAEWNDKWSTLIRVRNMMGSV